MGKTKYPSLGNYKDGNGEFNLFRMYKETLLTAFDKYKGEDLTFIAEKLGTTDRTIYRWLKVFNLQYLISENTKAKKLFVKM